MTHTEQLRNNMLEKIKELFQLNQPELDFGFYRIMHSRAREITRFIEHDLFDTIQNAFDSAKAESAQTELEAAKAKLLDAIGEDAFDENGRLKPAYANSKAGKEFLEAQQRAAAFDAIAGSEESVYYHLYKFFSRYYDSGDFISTRYHTRETDNMAKPYAVPYGGEEVMLHWANADQYYIKTTENFNDFAFDLSKAKIFESVSREERILAGIPDHALPVHFKVVEAEEGEHGNIKADPGEKREFFLTGENPVALNAGGELEIRFEYRTGEEGDILSPEAETLVRNRYDSKNKGDTSLLVLTEKVISACHNLKQALLDADQDASRITEFLVAMEYPCPTETVKKRILLTRYLYQYTARNTSDYFIHKDLRGFLRREMDFYIKNEIMNLDDIENSDVAAVENYLILLKVFRRIAGKLIDFLGQLEDFQKKLWLKKKFVVQSDFCITLDRVPETFYPEIAENEQQRNEWVRLHSIDRIVINPGGNVRGGWFVDADGKMDIVTKRTPQRQFGYSVPLSSGFLRENPFLMVDTRFFSDDFKTRLLASIPDFDEQCDGVLIHSENFQALNLLRERYREQVKCIYIDPPYNTGSDGFIYRDSYQHSSWLSMMYDRLSTAKGYLNSSTGFFSVSISEEEVFSLKYVLNICFNNNFVNNISVRRQDKNLSLQFVDDGLPSLSVGFEYVLLYRNSTTAVINPVYAPTSEKRATQGYWKGFWNDADRPTMRYEILGFEPTTGQWKWKKDKAYEAVKNYKKYIAQYSQMETLEEYWERTGKKLKFIRRNPKGGGKSQGVEHWIPPNSEKLRSSDWSDVLVLGTIGNNLALTFSSPKSEVLLQQIFSMTANNDSYLLDYFAGSGTTGHAVINLNREDGGKRKYILVEMGDHFDTVLKPRLEKVVFARDWKDGRPQEVPSIKGKHIIEESKKVLKNRKGEEVDLLNFSSSYKGTELEDNPEWDEHNHFNGVSHCFKYMRLESYEDTLNNLTLPEDSAAEQMPQTLREDYMLHYLLDTETRDSLLNIRDFANPFGGYQLNIKQPASEASVPTRVDLMETFHYLIGLRVQQYYTIQSYRAEFRRSADPELPDNGAGQRTRLELAARPELSDDGPWRFRKIEGWIPANPLTPNDGRRKNVLIVWRTLTGDLERDNLMLDWYLGDTVNLNEKRPEYDIVYVNGSNNLGADRRETDSFQVRLIEEEFLKQMWSGEER